LRQAYSDDAVFVVEIGVCKRRTLGAGILPYMKADARIAFAAVPVTPVAFDIAQPHRQLVHRRLNLLQTQHVRPLPLDEVQPSGLSRPNAVDVPGPNLPGSRSLAFSLLLRRVEPNSSTDRSRGRDFSPGNLRSAAMAPVAGRDPVY